MNINFINYLKILGMILIVFLLLWGLFYFISSNKKSLVSENNTSLQIINYESSKDVGRLQLFERDETDKIEKKESEDEKIIQKDKKVIQEEKAKEDSIKVKNKLVSWGFSVSSGRLIDTIILHSSYNALGGDEYDLDKLIYEYKEYGVAPHYLIDRKGDIYKLVEDKNIAYHAGVSKMPDGRNSVNNFSIGIEIINTKTDDYEKEQYEATQKLIDYLKKEYKVKYILGHEEIAPDRKTDPWNFDWNKVNISL